MIKSILNIALVALVMKNSFALN